MFNVNKRWGGSKIWNVKGEDKIKWKICSITLSPRWSPRWGGCKFNKFNAWEKVNGNYVYVGIKLKKKESGVGNLFLMPFWLYLVKQRVVLTVCSD